MRPSRREVLKALGLGAAASAIACGSDDPIDTPALSPPDEPWPGAGEGSRTWFPSGVSSGDPLPDRVMLWTHYAGQAVLQVHWALWDGEQWQDQGTEAVATSEGIVHHDLSGLPAGAWLAFQFVDGDGERSAVGHSRSAVSQGSADIVRFGATSCIKQIREAFPSMPNTMARAPLDFWCWLGDFAYFDSAEVLEEYRALWRSQIGHPDFQAVLANTASLFTWDDHEVGNNWNRDPNFPEERLATAYEAFFESTPLRKPGGRRIWRSFRFGRTAEVFVLDCRGERQSYDGVYISEEQMDWLKAGLAGSSATWKVVLNSVPITNLPGAYDVEVVLLDRWEGFPAQRAELLDHITSEGIEGVLFVAGDIHQGALAHLDPEGGSAHGVLEAIVGPAGSIPQPLGDLLKSDPQLAYTGSEYTCTFFELHPLGYARVVFVGDADETWYSGWIDTKGNVFDAEELILED